MTADISSDLKNWSSTAAGNQPDYSDVLGPNNLADNLRVLQKVIRDNVSHIQGAYSFATYYSGTTLDISSIPEQHVFFGAPSGNITSLGAVPASGITVNLYFGYSEGSGNSSGSQAAYYFQGGTNFVINKTNTSSGKAYIHLACRYTFVSDGTRWELTEITPLARQGAAGYFRYSVSGFLGGPHLNVSPASFYLYPSGPIYYTTTGGAQTATVRPGQLVMLYGQPTTNMALTTAAGVINIASGSKFAMLLYGATAAPTADETTTCTATCLSYTQESQTTSPHTISGQVTFSGGVPTLTAGSRGISSITDSGVGITTINFSAKPVYGAVNASIDGTAGTSTCNCLSNYSASGAATSVVYTFTSGAAADLNFCIEGTSEGTAT